jgi:SAM-dependent methyltransferase
MEAIYERPLDYDLEHEGDDDVAFYVRLITRLAPSRVLELAAGSGRVTIPLARAASRFGCDVVGVELAEPMRSEAERKRDELDADSRRRLTFVCGDMRQWRSEEPFDLVIAPCSSLSHLLALEDQLATWSAAFDNLRPGGRFVADLTMPNLPAYAESMQTPPRTLLEVDIDTQDPASGDRLLRYKTTRYLPHQQRAQIRFLYDKFPADNRVIRYVSDFDCHVYFPREVELLFRATGFTVVQRLGGYDGASLTASSRQLIIVGERPAA